MMIQVGQLSINPAYIAAVELDNRFYMNGSETYLVVTMVDGRVHRFKNGFDIDVHKIKKAIEAAQ